MVWFFFRVAIMAAIVLLPQDRTCQGQLILCGCWALFDLLWLYQSSRNDAYREPASLLFTGMLGMTLVAFLMGGPAVSLALCWPSLILRMNEGPRAYRYGLLLVVHWLLALSFPSQPLFMVPAALGMLQARPGKLARGANVAAVVWSLGPIVEALLFRGPHRELASLLRAAVLLMLPALGMRFVNRPSEAA